MQRIITVTANAALDWTCLVTGLRPGSRHLVRESYRQAGGKGVNVARSLAALGQEVRTIVVVGGNTGEEILRDLERADLAPIPVVASGESRTCLEIIDEGTGAATQLHEAGIEADQGTTRSLVAAVEQALANATWLALCGSLARGLPLGLYATLIHLARERGVRVSLDASGDALVEGYRAGPDLLRINRGEAAMLEELDLASPSSAAQRIARGFVSDGAGEIVAWNTDGSVWRIVPPSVAVRNTIGCGDAMLAGLLARVDSSGFEDAARFATALASADAESTTAGRPQVSRARELLDSVEIFRADGSQPR